MHTHKCIFYWHVMYCFSSFNSKACQVPKILHRLNHKNSVKLVMQQSAFVSLCTIQRIFFFLTLFSGTNGVHIFQWDGREFTLFSWMVWSSHCSVEWYGVYAVVLKTEWRYGVKTIGEVCRGFLVWLNVKALCR